MTSHHSLSTAADALSPSTGATSSSDSSTGSPGEAPAPFDRLVAFGDVHGDLQALLRVLRLANIVDESGAWHARRVLLVQTGDLVDRGDDDREVLAKIASLVAAAPAFDSEFVVLNGNHEIMNSIGDMRYVTPRSIGSYASEAEKPGDDARFAQADPAVRGRLRAFAPGGSEARILAARPIVYVAQQSVFVHGGLRPEYASLGVAAINAQARAWLSGEHAEPGELLTARDGPLWTRDYSDPAARVDCAEVEKTLSALNVKRMIMGHTVQSEGITSACDGALWRIDVGLSAYYGGPVQALELVGDEVRVLK